MLSSWWSVRMLFLLLAYSCKVSFIKCDEDTTDNKRLLNNLTNHSHWPSSSPSQFSYSTPIPTPLSSSILHEYIITQFDSNSNFVATYQAFANQETYLAYGTRVMLPPHDFPSLCGQNVPNSVHRKIEIFVEDVQSSFDNGLYYYNFDALFVSETNCPISEIVRNAKKLNEMSFIAGAVISFLIIPMNTTTKDTDKKISTLQEDGPTISPTSVNSDDASSYNSYRYDIDIGILHLPENSIRSFQSIFTESTNQDATSTSIPYYLDGFNETAKFLFNIEYKYPCDTDACDDQDPGGSMFLKYLGLLSVLILFCTPVIFLIRNQPVPTSLRRASTSENSDQLRGPLTEDEFNALPQLLYQSNVTYGARRFNQKSLTEANILNDFTQDRNNTTVINRISECKDLPSQISRCDTKTPEKNHSIEAIADIISNKQASLTILDKDSTKPSIENECEQYLATGTATLLNLDTSVLIDPESNEMCPICVETFRENEMVRVLPRCQHLYHNDCIRAWLLERKSEFCPTCKVNVKNDNDTTV